MNKDQLRCEEQQRVSIYHCCIYYCSGRRDAVSSSAHVAIHLAAVRTVSTAPFLFLREEAEAKRPILWRREHLASPW